VAIGLLAPAACYSRLDAMDLFQGGVTPHHDEAPNHVCVEVVPAVPWTWIR